MQFSPQQDAAIAKVAAWLRDDSADPVFYLAGFAGTGKTTIARHLAEQSDKATQFCAYTGKAALVMRRAGCDNARTIHSLIYNHKQKSGVKLKEYENLLASAVLKHEVEPDDVLSARIAELRKLVAVEREKVMQPNFDLKEDSDIKHAGLIVADECSMIDERMARHLMSFGKKILVLGDPAQLPPVKGSGYFTEREPDVLLTEIHRQAADNPIIAMATRIRNGESLALGSYGESRIITKAGSTVEDWLGSDQILVGRNATRTLLNQKARRSRGIETVLPVVGDRLICLHNDHEVGLLNGSLWTADEVMLLNADRLILTLSSLDDMPGVSCEAFTATFQNRPLDWRERMDAQEFDHAIAITVHKAQGSQWDDVTLVEEPMGGDARRWLYTGVTRAAERLTIIRN